LKLALHARYFNPIKGNLIGLSDSEKLEWESTNTRLELDRLKSDRDSDASGGRMTFDQTKLIIYIVDLKRDQFG